MKKKNIIIILIIALVIVVGIVILVNSTTKKYKKTKFYIDSENKYIFVTDTKFKTMQNDGGSHTSIYYQVGLENKVVYKCEDEYIGFEGYVVQGKLLEEINISEDEAIK